MPSPDLSRDFRARSRAWFMSCRKCGGDFRHPPVLMERRRARGEFRPPRLCSSCLLTALLTFARDAADA